MRLFYCKFKRFWFCRSFNFKSVFFSFSWNQFTLIAAYRSIWTCLFAHTCWTWWRRIPFITIGLWHISLWHSSLWHISLWHSSLWHSSLWHSSLWLSATFICKFKLLTIYYYVFYIFKHNWSSFITEPI